MSFQLSKDQLDAIDGICDELINSNPKNHVIAVLTGSAGTGKTTVIGEVIKQIKAKKLKNKFITAIPKLKIYK